MPEERSYEENIRRLEEIIRQFDRGDISLEEGLNSFEEGIALIKACQKQLDRVAQRIQALTGDGRLEELADSPREDKA